MKKTTFPVLSGKIASRQFDNGLRCYVLPRHQAEAVTLQAWIATGSIHEGRYLGYGLSHFLEHMLFQGTTQFPGNEISEKIAAFGGELNAATSSEYTYFYFNLPPDHLKDGLIMMNSMIREPLLPEKQFQSERDVILRELAMYRDSPLQHLFEKVRMDALRVHPLRYSAGGYPELLSAVTPEIMREYHRLRYTPDRTFYVVVGDVEPEKVFDSLEECAGNWPRGSQEEVVLPTEPPCIFRRNTRIEFPAPQAYYAATWQTPGTIHPDFIAVNAFSDILGDGDSSRLYEELVNRRMLAQDILFYSLALSSTGYSGAAAIADPAKMPELSERVFEILLKFAAEGPRDDELECLRNNQRAEYLRLLQTNEGIAPLIGKSVLQYGTPAAIDLYLPALDRLTKEDLIRVGQKYFAENAASVIEQYPAGFIRKQGKNPKKRLPPIGMQIPQRKEYPAGQKLIFLENHDLPLVNLILLMPGGILNESRRQPGLTRLLAETLAAGNAKYPEAEFHRRLERYAIDLNLEAGLSALTVSVTCPKEQLPTAVELFCAMLESPSFPEDAVKRERENLISTIKTALMKPETAARDLIRGKLFGRHPFGISGASQLKAIAGIQAEDLKNFYRNICLSAPGTVVGFSGDLTLAEADQWTGKIIRACRWNRYCPPLFPEPDFPVREMRKTTALPRQQAVVFTALPGAASGTPDADVLSLIRQDASSMASKLFQTVRNQNGLVYYAHFTGQPGFHFKGYMGYCGATTAAGVPELEKIFQEEIARLGRKGLSAEEFENARKMLLFQLENLRQSPEELLSALASAEFTGSGWEYIWNRKEKIQNLTLREFNRRVKELFTGKKAVTAVVLPQTAEGRADT